jgi:magnesium transporter
MADHQKQLLQTVTALIEQKSPDQLRQLLTDQRSSDIAEVLELLDTPDQRVIFDVLDTATAAEVFEKVDEATREEIFEILTDTEVTSLLSELDPDDAADILAELDREQSQQFLKHIAREHAEQIKDLMTYSEDSAGGIMDPAVVSVTEDATVAEAIEAIRTAEIDEDFYSVFVTNRSGQFLGDVRVRYLLTKPANTNIKQLIDTDTVYVNANTDQEEVRNIFKKNDLIVVPVLDHDSRLVGRITADRIIEVAEEEAAEDMYVMAGTDAAELESFSILHAARIRMTWLLPCLAGTAITATVALTFRNIYIHSDLLYVFITAFAFAPMIAAISGNAGLQTSAIVVCGLATGDLAAIRIGQVFAREVRVALLVAACCGILGGMICALLPGAVPSQILPSQAPSVSASTIPFTDHLRIVTAFSVAMFSAIMVATTLGLSLPFLFKRIGVDPAISSGPLVTTANDSISVTIYLTLTFLLVR